MVDYVNMVYLNESGATIRFKNLATGKVDGIIRLRKFGDFYWYKKTCSSWCCVFTGTEICIKSFDDLQKAVQKECPKIKSINNEELEFLERF